MKMRMRMQFELFTESQLAGFLDDALRVLAGVSFRVQGTDEFFDPLTEFGCRVDKEQVRFPKEVIHKVLDRLAARKREWLAGPGAEDDWPGSEIRMFTHGQALEICDLETNRLRPATEADLADWCRMVDAIGIGRRTHPTFIPTDVSRSAADFHAFAAIILNSRQPHRVSVYSAAMLPFFIEAERIVRGSLDEVKRHGVFATKCWVNTPFMLTRENVEIAMAARRLLGRPVELYAMPVAGASTPITVAGALVQNTAESLALCAMSLALDDVLTPIYSTQATMDMRAGAPRQSGPDMMLHALAGSEMRAYLVGGRPSTHVFSVTAQTVSPQSVHEKALKTAFNVATGERNVGVGCLATTDVGSPVQLVLDHELGLYFDHLLRDVSDDAEHVGLETILRTAPTGAHYLESDHTARFFREESWLPALIDNRLAGAWMQDPADLIDRARGRARELVADAENQCPLPADKRRQIQDLLNEADALVLRQACLG